MKRLFSLVLAVTLTVLLCSCGKTGFKTHDVSSDIYSEEDITGAKNAVVSRFSSENGITLLELYYAGDEKTEIYSDLAPESGDVIVLMSSFKTSRILEKNSTFTPNFTYENYIWVLIRNSGGEWTCIGQGVE